MRRVWQMGGRWHQISSRAMRAGRKSDEIGKVALLCDECHYKRHHTEEAMVIKDKVERYLEWMNDNFEDVKVSDEIYY